MQRGRQDRSRRPRPQSLLRRRAYGDGSDARGSWRSRSRAFPSGTSPEPGDSHLVPAQASLPTKRNKLDFIRFGRCHRCLGAFGWIPTSQAQAVVTVKLLALWRKRDLMADLDNSPGGRDPMPERTESAEKAARRPPDCSWNSSSPPVEAAALMNLRPTGERADPGLVNRLGDRGGL